MAQSPQEYAPNLTYVGPVTRAWASTGNTDTVTDDSVQATSQVVIMNTSARAGNWYVSNITPTSSTGGVVTSGSFTVTSSSSETATITTYKYILI